MSSASPVRVPLSVPVVGAREEELVAEALRSGWVSSAGPYVGRFEEALASRLGAPRAVATTNGTAAIHAALLAVGVGPGDRVAVPSLTFIASVNPVRYCGAEPLFVDSEEETGGMDPEALRAALARAAREGRPAKAVVPVHLFGHPADMEGILAAAREHGAAVIEDAAESLGSTAGGRATGTLGTAGCLSFNGNKILTTGGGGMVLTADEGLAARVRYLTTQARDDDFEYAHGAVGYNYRMTSLSAALGLAQLERLDGFLERKRAGAELYRSLLSGVPGTRLLWERAGTRSNFWMISLLLERRVAAAAKSRLIEVLRREGIESRPLFRPVHLQPPYRRPGVSLPVAEDLYARGVNLPNPPGLERGDAERAAAAVREAVRGLA